MTTEIEILDIWLSKLEYANKNNLTRYVFWVEDQLYMSEFRKGVWYAPQPIELI